MASINIVADDVFMSTAAGTSIVRMVIRLGQVQSDVREIFLTPNGAGGYNIAVVNLSR